MAPAIRQILPVGLGAFEDGGGGLSATMRMDCLPRKKTRKCTSTVVQVNHE